MKTSILLFLAFLSLGAQSQTSGTSIRRGVFTGMYSAVGGAILGLSTLSFYGKPEEHSGNILTGALIGLAAGVTYVIFESPGNETYLQIDPRNNGVLYVRRF